MRYFSLLYFIPLSVFVPNMLFAQSACKLSGKKVLFKEKHDVNLKFRKTHESINHKVNYIINNHKENHCPKSCIQKNDFKINISSVPKHVEKNTCKSTDEKYVFKKQFKSIATDSKIKDMDNAANLLTDWAVKTFLNPYVPFKKKQVSAEHKKILHSACPPCSFYLYYDYTFLKNNIVDSNILVKCGDRKIMKIFDANFITKFTLTHNWKCENKNQEPHSSIQLED